MIGRDHDVGGGGKPEIVEGFSQLRQIVVGIFDAGHRGGAIDSRRDGIEAVASVVLAAVRIARPEHQYKGLAARLKHRKHHLGGDVGHIGLLHGVGDRGPRRLGIAGLAVFSARGGRER